MTAQEKQNLTGVKDKLKDIIALARERSQEAKDAIPDLESYRLAEIDYQLDDITDKLVGLFE